MGIPEKKCSKCDEIYPTTSEFWTKDKRGKYGFKSYCKLCAKAYREQSYAKQRMKEYQKKWNEENAEMVREQKKEYYQKNKERIKERTRNYVRERRRTDKAFKMKCAVSVAVAHAMRARGHSKNGGSTFANLPYTPQQLKEHLEKQFDENMNWENYGFYWNIDHIYPQSKLPYDSLEHPNFKKCWALDNLRPLEAIENIKKRDKIIKE